MTLFDLFRKKENIDGNCHNVVVCLTLGCT